MQFPESWLRSFCNPDLNTQALADLLTMAGMEVEALDPVAPPFSGVVVGEIVSAEPHPNADRLRVCRVDAGAHSPGGPLQIVCGAPNARVGIKVPLATVGALLPPGEDGKPFAIKLGKLRGVESHGMLCSSKELQISGEAAGLLELAADAPPGADLREWLRLDDTLFTLKLTPNLGHALSVFGIAREVAALTGAPLHVPAVAPVAPASADRVAVKIEAPDLCGRFSGRVVRGIDPAAQTPAWMVERLERCGQRPVNALVDISNYVMFELGRPSHIFDLERLHGGLQVRWGRQGETLKLLNGNTITVDEQVGVIADEQGLESLAGIMGGDATAVSDSTQHVYVEAAFWWPEAVAGRSRRYNFSTDAGHRFERGVDPASTVEHIERITALILQICGGQPGPIDDQITALPERAPVRLRVSRAAKIIGRTLTRDDCAAVMTRLGLPYTEEPDALVVTPPSWRFDLTIEEDLIEEVARILGYEGLPARAPVAPVVAKVRREAQRSPHALRRHLAALGYFETINFSFVEARWEQELAGNPDPIRLLNPIAAPLSVMRSSLMGSLVHVLQNNLARRIERARLFEIGRVFFRDPASPAGDTEVAGVRQPLHVAGLAWGGEAPLQWGVAERPVDFFDVKGDVEALLAPARATFLPCEHPALHPGRCAAIELAGRRIGVVGELHPRWRQAYDLPSSPVLFELEAQPLLESRVPEFQALPRHLGVTRDLALIVDETVGHDKIQHLIRTAAHAGLVRDVRLFDVYKPKQVPPGMQPGERSLAVRIDLRDEEATLTEARIDAAVAAIVEGLGAAGVRLRT